MESDPKKLKKRKSKIITKKKTHAPVSETKVSNKAFLNQTSPSYGGKWKDDLFPPNENSLLGKDLSGNPIDPIEFDKNNLDPGEIEWKRAKEIFPKPYLFEEEISTKNIRPGKMANCYFMSAVAALTRYPGLISKIFLTKEYNKDGFYKLLLFIDGEFQVVFVDDYFPCLKGTSVPYFSKTNSFEMWFMLLEKAWAKVNGGYVNIISGYPRDVFRFLTGMPCEQIVFDLYNDTNDTQNIDNDIKNQLIDNLKSEGPSTEEGKDIKNLVCLTTKNDREELTDTGLESSHSYIVDNLVEIKNGDENSEPIYLFKLRNPWGDENWTGDWGKQSDLWTDSVNEQIKPEIRALNKNEFFIELKDVFKYFLRTDICYIICDPYIKIFDFNTQSDLAEPQIISFYLHNEGNVVVSIIEKNWRFNRTLREISHPTSMVLVEYDPNNKIIKSVIGDYEDNEDIQKVIKLTPGYYLIWVYKALNESESPLPEGMKIEIISESQISLKHLGPDKEFEAIKQIIYQNAKVLNDSVKDEIYHEIENDFKNSGLGYRLAINPLTNTTQKWEVDASVVQDYTILPPFKDQQKFNIDLFDYIVILAIRNKKYGTFCFNVDGEGEEIEEPTPQANLSTNNEIKKDILENFFIPEIKDEPPLLEKKSSEYIPLENLFKKEDYPKIDHTQSFIDKHKDDSKHIQELIDMDPQEGEKKLGWIELKQENGEYIGEADYVTPQGRGCFIYKGEGMTWVGYFDNGGKGNFGKLYDGDGKLVYEGDYKAGVRHGNGTYYYANEGKYEGEFVNGLREGKGTFYWDEDTRWEGTFTNNEMNGDGIYYEEGESHPIKYNMGEQVEEEGENNDQEAQQEPQEQQGETKEPEEAQGETKEPEEEEEGEQEQEQ